MRLKCAARDPDGASLCDDAGSGAQGSRRQRTQRPCAAFVFVAQVFSRGRMRVLFRKIIPHD
jgi:hypothetical protein